MIGRYDGCNAPTFGARHDGDAAGGRWPGARFGAKVTYAVPLHHYTILSGGGVHWWPYLLAVHVRYGLRIRRSLSDFDPLVPSRTTVPPQCGAARPYNNPFHLFYHNPIVIRPITSSIQLRNPEQGSRCHGQGLAGIGAETSRLRRDITVLQTNGKE